MIRRFCLASILAALACVPASAQTRHAAVNTSSSLDALVARHAAANNVPEDLVRRIIKRESGGRPGVISKGNYGLMQIRLGTARAMGYRGGAQGLLDADTNMTYAVKYLAGAYHAAGRNHDQAVRYYAGGYYYAAKRKGLLDKNHANPIGAFASAAAGGGAASAVNVASAAKVASAATDPVDPVEKVADARDEGKNVTSGSDLYTGRLDYF
jgi:soluble lytic murein transglycosylase-like protein